MSRLWLRVVLVTMVILLSACSRDPRPSAATGCESGYVRLIAVVLGDRALTEYANAYFEGVADLVVVWEGAPAVSPTCNVRGIRFRVIPPSAMGVEPAGRLFIVRKLYLDDTAAFMSVSLHPTGKNGDFLLRKEGAWRVVQHSLWEN